MSAAHLPNAPIHFDFEKKPPRETARGLAPLHTRDDRAAFHMKLNTYLNFGGNCEEAFRFYEQHLGGNITMLMRRAEQPNTADTWPGWEQSIQYAIMTIGETELMGADVAPDRFKPMRSVYLSLTVGDADEAERIYALLSDGGQVFMPMEETFFAVRFAMLRDRFGTSWMILALRAQAA
jgi:PhnB protein